MSLYFLVESFAVIFVLNFVIFTGGEISLIPLSVTYLPYKVLPKPRYALFQPIIEQIAYDPVNNHIYTIGGTGVLWVVDIANPRRIRYVYRKRIGEFITDVALCDGYVALSLRRDVHTELGRVYVYKGYDPELHGLTLIHNITVGSSPASSLVFTADCRTLVVANEGEAGVDASGTFYDPQGSVSIIKFTSSQLETAAYTTVNASFEQFDDRMDDYRHRGVHHAFRCHPDAPDILSRDLEPEYITLNTAQTSAYVTLQENNAIAVVDLIAGVIEDIYPLPVKFWSQSALDASDRDGGINIKPWPIMSLYQPDAIRHFEHGGQSYLATANEGDPKSYTLAQHGINWTEQIRGNQLVSGNFLDSSVNKTVIDFLSNDDQLGRLYFSRTAGVTDSGLISDPHTFGGRSFSIWNADDLSLVYDSGSDIEQKHAQLLPELFNSHIDELFHCPTDDSDVRSDDMGPEVEVIETAHYNNRTYIFIGNQRLSSIIVYSIFNDVTKPTFELLHRAGATNQTWQELHQQKIIGDANLQDIIYVAPSSTTSGEHLLLVSGSISGTLTVYCIQFDVNDVTSCLKRSAQTRKPPWEKQNYTTYSKEREKSNDQGSLFYENVPLLHELPYIPPAHKQTSWSYTSDSVKL